VSLPPPGEYAVGNIFFSPDTEVCKQSQRVFEKVAFELGLKVLAWRVVPRDNTILGPSSKSQEPSILQPFLVAKEDSKFDRITFQKQLYLLRKKASKELAAKKWFYVCSLSNSIIVYKGLLAPVQVYTYFDDLTNPNFESHFCIVHSRFSTNTFPSWDRAQVR
jgi:glutamate synthase (NADH)